MTEQDLIALLTQQISFQLRHAHYDRTIEVGSDCHMMTTGAEQEREVLKYRRFEKQELKAQRLRLNNPATPIYISEADILDRLTRVDGIRRDITAKSDDQKRELEAAGWNFQPGKDIETWLVEKVRFLGKNDPNAWILFDRADKRSETGDIEKTTIRPVVFRSTDVLNFEYDGEGVPVWALFRDFRFEYVVQGGVRKDMRLETYYLYSHDFVIRAREIGEQTEARDGETRLDVDVYPLMITGEARYDDDGMPYQLAPVVQGEKKTRSFYISVIQHGAGEVPAFCVGAYPDEETDQQTFVSWFWAGMPVLKDVIRDKQMLDVAIVMQAFRRRSEFSPACEYETEEGAACEKGWIHGAEGKRRCPSCGGSGLRANFNTEQEVLRMALPEGAEPNQILELSKLAFEEPTDTTLLEWFSNQLEKHRTRFNNAILGDGMYERPTGTATKTATEVGERTDAKADILRPSANVVSKGYELFFRVLAAYRELGEVTVNHSYPEKIDLLTLEQEVANYGAIQEIGIIEAKAAQRHKVLVKLFEGEPETHKRIAAWYRWLPFDDQSPEQLAATLSMLSPTDYFHILRTYWLQIRQEVEVKTPDFYLMSYEQQKAIVDAKVAEYQAKIQLAGADMVSEPPNFNSDDEQQTQETLT